MLSLIWLREGPAWFCKTMLNHTLHLLQQHGFVVEVSANWTDLPPDLSPVGNIWSILKPQNTKKDPWTVEQLEFLTRQKWDNNPLPEVQQLVSSAPWRLRSLLLKEEGMLKHGPVPTFLRCVLTCTSNLRWANIFHQTVISPTFKIWYICSALMGIRGIGLRCLEIMPFSFHLHFRRCHNFLELGLFYRDDLNDMEQRIKWIKFQYDFKNLLWATVHVSVTT